MSTYLTVEGYLHRYGQQETATITNEVRATAATPPAIVAPKVEEAIADAEDVVDAYIGTRYALPLSTVPRLVEGWTAVLAREFLYKNRPNPTVTEAADRVRVQMKDLAARRMNLPVPEGEAAPAEGSNNGSAQTSGDAPCATFSASRLDSFMGGFGRGASVPCWRTGGK